MAKQKTEYETCYSCHGYGYTNSGTEREPEPNHGCTTCGGDKYDDPYWGSRMKKGSGKLKNTYEWDADSHMKDGGYWRRIDSKPSNRWF